MNVKEIIKQMLQQTIDNLDAGNSNITEEDGIEIINTINQLTNTKNKYSKYQACKYLHISRSTFDNWVRDGKIPEGRSQQGFKEKFWLLEDLQNAKVKNNRG